MSLKNDFIFRKLAGSKRMNEPRRLSEVLNEYFAGNSPLAVAYRDRLFKNLHPDTHLDVDLKLLTREPGHIPVGAMLDGAITRDEVKHFCFIQNDPEKKKVLVTVRNPHVYLGKRINVNRKDDGTLYPTFNRPQYTESFTFQDFCREAAEELLAVAGLVEE